MRYAPFLKMEQTIQLVAPSYGSPMDPYLIRLNEGIKAFEHLGFHLIKGKRIYHLNKEESDTPQHRAKELMQAYLSKNNQWVWSVAGGELMLLILDYLDLDLLKKAPAKWFMGYSDNTTFTYLLTTAMDVASIYSYHIGTFCATPWKKYQRDIYQFMCGKKFSFHSYPKYELQDIKDQNPICYFNLTEPVYWKSLEMNDKIHMKGRCIGGCIEVLEHIAGTKYDYTAAFLEKYKKDGFIWYFDICELTPVGLSRVLFQLKATHWFQYVKGFMF